MTGPHIPGGQVGAFSEQVWEFVHIWFLMEVFVVSCEMGIESVPNLVIFRAGCQEVQFCFHFIPCAVRTQPGFFW